MLQDLTVLTLIRPSVMTRPADVETVRFMETSEKLTVMHNFVSWVRWVRLKSTLLPQLSAVYYLLLFISCLLYISARACAR